MRMIRISLLSSVLMIASQFSDLSAAIEKHENSRNLPKCTVFANYPAHVIPYIPQYIPQCCFC